MSTEARDKFAQMLFNVLAKEVQAVVWREDNKILVQTDDGLFTITVNKTRVPSKREQKELSEFNRQRTANRIDGYNRDDLGESPDY